MFSEGDKIKAIYLQPSMEWNGILRVGENDIDAITVVMENGQMAGVPWFEVSANGAVQYKYNAAIVEGVELFPPVTTTIGE